MAFSTFFLRDNFRPEVVSDVITSVGVEQVSVDVSVKFGDLGQAVLEM